MARPFRAATTGLAEFRGPNPVPDPLNHHGVVESNLAFLVLFAVGIVDSLLLYRFFTVQLPGVKRVEQLAASDSPAGAYAHRAPAPKKAGHYA